MHRRLRHVLLTALLALTLAACGDTPAQPTALPTSTSSNSAPTAETAATNTTGTEATSPPSAASPTSPQGNSGGVDSQGSGNASIINVVVTGGPHAGTYERRSSDPTCSAGLTGEGSWGNQYSDPDIKNGLSSLQLIVDDRDDAADGTDEFLTTFSFGDMLSPDAQYTYDGRNGTVSRGKSGNVQVEQSGQSGKVTIQIEPEDGVRIDATIQCNEVVSGGIAAPTRTQGPQDTTATLNLTLAGAEPVGTFNLTSTQEGVCGYGPESGSLLIEGVEDPSDTFTVEYYGEEGSDISRFWLTVLDTSEAAGGTSKFWVEVNEDQEYMVTSPNGAVEGAPEDGTGTVRVQNNGDTATLNLDVQSNDGKSIKATIECKVVSR